MLLVSRFNTSIDEYLSSWDKLNKITRSLKPISVLKRYYHFYIIRKQLIKISKSELSRPVANSDYDLTKFKDDPEIDRLIRLWLQFDIGEMDDSLKGNYIEATEAFISRVRLKWPQMDNESIFQALRNVWIMIAIQMMCDHKIELTDAMFAYSMLYPLTDNVLDDSTLSKQEKFQFIEALGNRLNGITGNETSPQYTDVYDMVSLIESQYSREQYPLVYESLCLIHACQKESMKQQYSQLDISQISKISFEKGASSVIADGYLVLGKLDTDQFDFLTGYGIVLQLADDLQDMTSDAFVSHRTLFSFGQTRETLAENVEKLCLLSSNVLLNIPTQNIKLKSNLTLLLEKSMNFLITDAIQMHRNSFDKSYIRKISKNHFTGLTHHSRLKKIGEEMVARWV
ncbi:hypothetical protein QE109_06560 [Fusibacter bizertensis]|uniref:Uncharacterized protein n=1 Tax=Fusibacter bizertensis TaxID=1488331 RepID=A0ABT6NBN4_9FIRM|nr:hypothetical protein [Fusibacter bizertensis]MDH8677801.1 hypothetical protein [Fusibacter bizertensis]